MCICVFTCNDAELPDWPECRITESDESQNQVRTQKTTCTSAGNYGKSK